MRTRLDREDPYAFETLWRQYRACRRNKRNTVDALRFELNAEENLLALQRELRERTYRPGPSICFVTNGPKPREVFAADFRDRVVHHVLVSRHRPRAPVVRPAVPRAFLRGAGDQALVFDRVGAFFEFRGPQRLLAERRLALRRVWLPRGGFGFAAGFHHSMLLRYVRRALAGVGPPGAGGGVGVAPRSQVVAGRARAACREPG